MSEMVLNYPLEKHNTFGIKVFAREFAELREEADIIDRIRMNMETHGKMFVMGGGSNILFTGDFDGLVVKVSTCGRTIIAETKDEVLLKVAAGEDWDGLVAFCVDQGWYGLENLSGIPGQAGSSPIQNIGAYGVELKDVFHSLEAINRCTAEKVVYDAERCQFGYRDSIFKRALKDRVLISNVVFRLKKRSRCNLEYNALKQRLSHLKEDDVTPQVVRDAVLDIRRAKLPDPMVIGNAGSFFKNPVITYALLNELKEKYPELVYYESAVGAKLAAGWLIEKCGWKGYREGDAGVHKEQALVLVNHGHATGRQILDLAAKIEQSVHEKFGVRLEREVNVV